MSQTPHEPSAEPPSTDNERAQAIRDWMQTSSAAAPSRRGKRGGLIVVGVALIAIAGVYLWQRGGSDVVKKTDDLQLAERAPVKPLTASQPVAQQADPASVPTSEARDPLAEERERLALQQAEQQRKLQEARLKSAIVTSSANVPVAASGNASESNGSLTPANEGAQDANSRYLRQTSGQGVAVSQARRIEHLPYKVLQGKIIDAVVPPRIISDLPGTLRATVQRDIVGEQGRNVLIPWGSTLIGQYRAELKKGQSRIFTVWQRVIRPDGVDVVLDSPGADQLGTAGMGGDVDHHFAQIFGISALLSVIGAGSSTVGVSSNNQDNSSAYYREQVQEAAANSAQRVLGGYADLPPTITVAPGTRIKVFVNRDLDFSGLDAPHSRRVTVLE